MTDILVDATQRHDASQPLVPNAWIGLMPEHAVICDLVVDPYLLDAEPVVVRGIEGIPQGDLNQWEFGPDDPAWEQLPPEIPTAQRRTVVSCYSWPGVRPEPCMHVYGSTAGPDRRGTRPGGRPRRVRADGTYHERAIWRASLRAWLAANSPSAGEQPDGDIPGGLVPGATTAVRRGWRLTVSASPA